MTPVFVFLVVDVDINGEATAILACYSMELAEEIANKIGGRVERVPVVDPVLE